MAREHIQPEKTIKPTLQKAKPLEKSTENRTRKPEQPLEDLQRQVGNRAVQRLFIQRKSEAPYELDEETENRINQERGSGQPLDSQMQAQMEKSTGQGLGNVQVHTSEESEMLNRQLGAKAFTTGSDIFFTNGAYQPGSSGGQELIAHELTHVLQQQSGAAGSGTSKMTVNAPHDAFEQEADAVAKSVVNPSSNEEVQEQARMNDEDENIHRQEIKEEDKDVYMLQMNVAEEDEEKLEQ